MKYKIAVCYGLLCFLVCLALQTGLCEAQPVREPFSPESAVEGAQLVQVMQNEAAAQSFKRTLEEIRYTSISDGKTVTFPLNDGGTVLRCRTLDLDTLQESDGVTLRTFGGGETLLRVLPRVGGFFALTNRALYGYDDALKLFQTKPLPDVLMGMKGLEEKLRLSGEVNQDGTLLLFEAQGQEEGIYLCALEPGAEPSLLLPGVTFADANGDALEGYKEARFVAQDRVAAYLWGKEGRIAYELFDLEGRRLYQSFVFNQRADAENSANASLSQIRRHEDENADGFVLGAPTSLNTIWGDFYYFDYGTLLLDRVTSWALEEDSIQFCALEGKVCTFALADLNFDEMPRSDIHFFRQDLTTTEVEELPFVLRDVSEFTAALAPGGRVLFVCKDDVSGTYYRGVFRLP